MPRARTSPDSLAELFDASSRPIYAVDDRRRIVYCNRALTAWIDLHRTRVVGRVVEYHSESAADSSAREEAPLTDLCPPPRALAGEPVAATISCAARGGGLVHRRADFVPFGNGVLVLLSERDLTPQELAGDLSREPSSDDLHRVIRQFRRAQTAQYAMETLLGESSAMRLVRSQVAAAAAGGANALICGRPGSGRGHVARAIHYRAAGDDAVKLIPIDCELANDDLLRRALTAVREPSAKSRERSTLLLENLDRLVESLQPQLLEAIQRNMLPARIIATCCRPVPCAADAGSGSVPAAIDAALRDAVATITIELPRLCERPEDLPILAQYYLEAANRDRGKQVGSIRSDAMELLVLHSWPGELVELREVIAAAHRAASTHEISSADLPPVVHHAAKSAARARRPPERIVLDNLLADIEKEAIVRALAQSGGNKSEAAELLGMTRPRLYRRLVQLGLAGPEFIEQEPGTEPQ